MSHLVTFHQGLHYLSRQKWSLQKNDQRAKVGCLFWRRLMGLQLLRPMTMFPLSTGVPCTMPVLHSHRAMWGFAMQGYVIKWCFAAALPRGATGLSAVCDCGISWSYPLTILGRLPGAALVSFFLLHTVAYCNITKMVASCIIMYWFQANKWIFFQFVKFLKMIVGIYLMVNFILKFLEEHSGSVVEWLTLVELPRVMLILYIHLKVCLFSNSNADRQGSHIQLGSVHFFYLQYVILYAWTYTDVRKIALEHMETFGKNAYCSQWLGELIYFHSVFQKISCHLRFGSTLSAKWVAEYNFLLCSCGNKNH